MKTLFLALTLFCIKAHGQIIGADSAINYVGKKVTVCSTITGEKTTNKVKFLNFGPGYPNQTFTAVIFSKDFSKFADVTSWAARAVCITGTIELYKGKPEIIITSKDQVSFK